MNFMLQLSRLIDRINEAVGRAAIWLILVVVLISAGNAVSRFAFNMSSNAMLEVQWYLFSAIFLACAAYVLKKNEHIRIDVIAGRFSERAQNWIDVFGILVFLLPMAVLIAYLSWPVFMNAGHYGEVSAHAHEVRLSQADAFDERAGHHHRDGEGNLKGGRVQRDGVGQVIAVYQLGHQGLAGR
jgi:TRAP-type mannitol/chloroaromatic compound transport system permease small subunit